MAKGKFVDFDAFWAEATQDEDRLPKIKVFGEVVTLPASPPAMIVLDVLRAQSDPELVVDPASIAKIADSLFGKERVDAWAAKGLTIQQLGDLVTRTIDMYMNSDEGEDEDDEGNPRPAQAAGGEKSSKTGA